jgi:hypothetical protein
MTDKSTSSPRKPKPVRLNLKTTQPTAGQDIESPSSILAPRLEDLHIPTSLDLQPQDIITISELGAGNGGTVSKVCHEPTKTIMARKVLCSNVDYTCGSQKLCT